MQKQALWKDLKGESIGKGISQRILTLTVKIVKPPGVKTGTS